MFSLLSIAATGGVLAAGLALGKKRTKPRLVDMLANRQPIRRGNPLQSELDVFSQVCFQPSLAYHQQ